MSPTLFNLVMENIIRTWLAMIVEDQRLVHYELRESVGRCMGGFYANEGMVGSRDPDWLQHSMNLLVNLFRWYGLAANAVKSRYMACQPGALRPGMSAEAKALKCMGVRYSY